MSIENESFDVNEFTNFFLQWEQASRQSLDVKLIYIDMAGDLAAGFALSQIVYWHLPSSTGASRLRVQHEGHYWIAKARDEWWDECRVTARQMDRVIKNLEEKGLIKTCVRKFQGTPKTHLRLDWEVFLRLWNEQLARQSLKNPAGNPTSPFGEVHFTEPSNPTSPFGEVHFTTAQSPCTKTTTETTQKLQQQPVVDSSTSLNSVLSESEAMQLKAELIQLRVSPDRAEYLIKTHPDRVGQAARWWRANPEYHSSRNAPGGAVAASITNPAKYPQVYAEGTKEKAPTQKPRRGKVDQRRKFASAYERVWNSLSATLREAVINEGKNPDEYLERHHSYELSTAIIEQRRSAQDA